MSVLLPFHVRNQDIIQYGNSYAICFKKNIYFFASTESFFTTWATYDPKKHASVDIFIIETIKEYFPFYFMNYKKGYIQAFNFDTILPGTGKLNILFSAINKINYVDIEHSFIVASKIMDMHDIVTVIRKILIDLFLIERLKESGTINAESGTINTKNINGGCHDQLVCYFRAAILQLQYNK